MKKRVSAFLLAACLAAMTGLFAAASAGPAATAENGEELIEWLTGAGEGALILYNDISVPERPGPLTVVGKKTLDLNGHTVTFGNDLVMKNDHDADYDASVPHVGEWIVVDKGASLTVTGSGADRSGLVFTYVKADFDELEKDLIKVGGTSALYDRYRDSDCVILARAGSTLVFRDVSVRAEHANGPMRLAASEGDMAASGSRFELGVGKCDLCWERSSEAHCYHPGYNAVYTKNGRLTLTDCDLRVHVLHGATFDTDSGGGKHYLHATTRPLEIFNSDVTVSGGSVEAFDDALDMSFTPALSEERPAGYDIVQGDLYGEMAGIYVDGEDAGRSVTVRDVAIRVTPFMRAHSENGVYGLQVEGANRVELSGGSITVGDDGNQSGQDYLNIFGHQGAAETAYGRRSAAFDYTGTGYDMSGNSANRSKDTAAVYVGDLAGEVRVLDVAGVTVNTSGSAASGFHILGGRVTLARLGSQERPVLVRRMTNDEVPVLTAEYGAVTGAPRESMEWDLGVSKLYGVLAEGGRVTAEDLYLHIDGTKSCAASIGTSADACGYAAGAHTGRLSDENGKITSRPDVGVIESVTGGRVLITRLDRDIGSNRTTSSGFFVSKDFRRVDGGSAFPQIGGIYGAEVEIHGGVARGVYLEGKTQSSEGILTVTSDGEGDPTRILLFPSAVGAGGSLDGGTSYGVYVGPQGSIGTLGEVEVKLLHDGATAVRSVAVYCDGAIGCFGQGRYFVNSDVDDLLLGGGDVAFEEDRTSTVPRRLVALGREGAYTVYGLGYLRPVGGACVCEDACTDRRWNHACPVCATETGERSSARCAADREADGWDRLREQLLQGAAEIVLDGPLVVEEPAVIPEGARIVLRAGEESVTIRRGDGLDLPLFSFAGDSGSLTLLGVRLEGGDSASPVIELRGDTSLTLGAGSGIFNARGGAVRAGTEDAPFTGSITMETGSAIAGCSVQGDGGAVSVRGGGLHWPKVTVTDITDCEASGGSGGAVWAVHADVAVFGALTGNRAGREGGAIYIEDGDLTLDATVVSGRAEVPAAIDGGAVYARRSRITVAGGTYTCAAGGEGGGMYVADSSAVYFTGPAAFTGSRALRGGGIYVAKGAYVYLNDGLASFIGNAAAESGGGLYAEVALTVRDGVFRDNTAGGFGGAIYGAGSCLIVEGGVYTGNAADAGSVLYAGPGCGLEVTGGVMRSESGNDNVNRYGAVAADPGTALIAVGGSLDLPEPGAGEGHGVYLAAGQTLTLKTFRAARICFFVDMAGETDVRVTTGALSDDDPLSLIPESGLSGAAMSRREDGWHLTLAARTPPEGPVMVWQSGDEGSAGYYDTLAEALDRARELCAGGGEAVLRFRRSGGDEIHAEPFSQGLLLPEGARIVLDLNGVTLVLSDGDASAGRSGRLTPDGGFENGVLVLERIRVVPWSAQGGRLFLNAAPGATLTLSEGVLFQAPVDVAGSVALLGSAVVEDYAGDAEGFPPDMLSGGRYAVRSTVRAGERVAVGGSPTAWILLRDGQTIDLVEGGLTGGLITVSPEVWPGEDAVLPITTPETDTQFYRSSAGYIRSGDPDWAVAVNDAERRLELRRAYRVTVNGAPREERALRGGTYTFPIPGRKAGDIYAVSVTVGGVPVDARLEDGVITLPAEIVTGDIAISWERLNGRPVTLTLHGCGGSFGDSETAFVEARIGEDFPPLAAPVREGYVFSGWSLLPSGEGPLADVSGAVTFLRDTALYARWTARASTLTFDPDGGTMPPGGEAPVTVVYGGVYPALPLPSRPGFVFDGWYAGAVRIESGGTVRIAGDTTLRARWTRIGAPAARRLTYTGEEQTLVELPEGSLGLVLFSLTREGRYSPALPTAVDAGVYTVWYRFLDAGGHSSEPESLLAVVDPFPLTLEPVEVESPYTGKAVYASVRQRAGELPAIRPEDIRVTYRQAGVAAEPVAPGVYDVTVSLADGNFALPGGAESLTVGTVTVTHVHKYASGYEHDGAFHWHRCAGAGPCPEDGVLSRASHDFSGQTLSGGGYLYTCRVCGYSRTVPAGGRSVSGTVLDRDGSPAGGVAVSLRRGGVTVAATVTDERGEYLFLYVEPGAYSLVAERDGLTTTSLADVEDSRRMAPILLPSGRASSFLEVPGTPEGASADLSGIAAGGLEREAEEASLPGGAISVTLTVETLEDAPANAPEVRRSIDAIKAAAGDASLEFLELSVRREVESAGRVRSESLDETRNLITLVIPYDFEGKGSVTLYRCHNGAVQVLTEGAGADGTYTLDRDRGLIYLYATRFSTYAIGYVPEGPGKAPAGPYTVNLPAAVPGGAVTADRLSAKAGQDVTLTASPDLLERLASLSVLDADGGWVPFTVNGDGTYTFQMPAGDVWVQARFEHVCPSEGFPDLDPRAWYHEYTDYMLHTGVMHGYDTGDFAPEGTVTRAEMVTVLWNLTGRAPADAAMDYTDVPTSAWYYKAVQWAAGAGVAGGYEDGSFRPDQPVTREEMAVMLYRFDQKLGSGKKVRLPARLSFADAGAVSDWALEAVKWCAKRGFINGEENNRFNPADTAERDELAAILTRYMKSAGQTK